MSDQKIKHWALLDTDREPPADIAICACCGWRGSIGECGTDQDGDWENGYFDIHTCPKCDDGGCIDNYDMTPERAKEWQEWHDKRKGVAK